MEESPTAANPYVQLPADDRYKIAFFKETISEQLIKNNVTIAFIVYTDDYYCRYGFKCTTLPLLNISCVDEKGAEIPMSIRTFDNQKGSTCRVVHSDGVIRVRDGWTRNYPKGFMPLDTR